MTDLKLIRTIEVADLDDIATGGAILGTGGGGDPYVGKLMAQEAIRRHGPVRLVDVDGFAADALIAPVCMMGAPRCASRKPDISLTKRAGRSPQGGPRLEHWGPPFGIGLGGRTEAAARVRRISGACWREAISSARKRRGR
jgi:Protein of unknown function (DUF917)